MEPQKPGTPEADLARRRADIRRSLLRVSTAGLVVVLVVVGLAIAAVLAAFRSQDNARRALAATARAEEELRNSYIAQARAGRLSALMGSKEAGVAAISAAARIRPDIEPRTEAIAHLALLDLRDEGLRWRQRGSGQLVVFDGALEQFAMSTSATELVVGRVADQQVVCRHSNPLVRLDRPLEFSPDGRHLAVAYAKGSLMVFDVAAQKPAFWAKSSEVVRGVAFSPDGALTAHVHEDRSVRVVRTSDGEELRQLQPDGQPYLVQFDSEGKRLAISAGRRVQVMDWATNKTTLRLTHDAAITAFAWNGPVLALGDDNGEMVLRHEVSGTQRRFVAHQGRVSDLIFFPDGTHVLSASYDGSTRLWDAHTGRLVVSTTAGYGRQVGRDGRRVAYANAQGWGLWEVRRPTGYRALHTVDGLKPAVMHLDFSLDGAWLSVAKEGALRIAEVETGEFLLNHRETGLVPWAQFLPDGQTLLTAPKGALALRPFTVTTNGNAPSSKPGSSRGNEAPTNQSLVTSAATSVEKSVRVMELGQGRRVELPGGISAGIGAMSPDRRKAVFPFERTSLAAVDVREPEKLLRFEGSVRALRPALGPADSWMVSGSLHGAGTLLWDAATGKKLRQLFAGNAFCFASANGRLVAVAGSDACRIFDTRMWEVVKEISSERGTELPGYAAFSADGRLFATVKENSRVQLWDPRSWRMLADLISPDPQIISWLAFSPDTRRLAVATNRDRVELWELGTLRAELGKMNLDWSDRPDATDTSPIVAAAPPGFFASRARLLLFTVAGSVAVVLLCAAFVLRRQRELIRAYLDVDRQMEQRTRQLDLAQAEILHGQKMKALGTLAAGIAHDFNNLLSIIRMANKLTAKQTQSDLEVQDNVRLVEKAVGQGKQLVNSMLGYSREPADDQGPCAIAEVVENAVNLLSKQFLGGLEVKLELDRNLPPAALAKGRLEQILLNLIVNASEAMNGQGTLRIAVEAAPGTSAGWMLPPAQASRYVRVVVADSGPGIAPEVLPRIFEPFFTTKNTGTTRGTGLGLSMVYTLAQNEGLGLRVESECGKGTAFHVVIPVREA
jgi:signal transduction histidine kinase